MKTTLFTVKVGDRYLVRDDNTSYLTPLLRHAHLFDSSKDAGQQCELDQMQEYSINILEIEEKELISVTVSVTKITTPSTKVLENLSLSIGTWKCEKSPVKTCVYSDIIDSAHNSCIYCGEPEERK